MTTCPAYRVPFWSQLQEGGKTGDVDCTPSAGSRAIGHATCGAKVPSSRTIRLLSDEPVPDRTSPGLNLDQVAKVALRDYGVYLEVHVGPYALTWKEYEDAREEGRGGVLQGIYAPIADSPFDAGRGFRDAHAVFENQHSTLDSLADGRARGVWKYDGRLYPRGLMRDFAQGLFGKDRIWCALTRDVVPRMVAEIRPRTGSVLRQYRSFRLVGGVIAGGTLHTTKGFQAPCTAPRAIRNQNGTLRFLVQIEGGPHSGEWVGRQWSHTA